MNAGVAGGGAAGKSTKSVVTIGPTTGMKIPFAPKKTPPVKKGIAGGGAGGGRGNGGLKKREVLSSDDESDDSSEASGDSHHDDNHVEHLDSEAGMKEIMHMMNNGDDEIDYEEELLFMSLPPRTSKPKKGENHTDIGADAGYDADYDGLDTELDILSSHLPSLTRSTRHKKDDVLDDEEEIEEALSLKVSDDGDGGEEYDVDDDEDEDEVEALKKEIAKEDSLLADIELRKNARLAEAYFHQKAISLANPLGPPLHSSKSTTTAKSISSIRSRGNVGMSSKRSFRQTSEGFTNQEHFDEITNLIDLCTFADLNGNTAAHHAAYIGLFLTAKALFKAGSSRWVSNFTFDTPASLLDGLGLGVGHNRASLHRALRGRRCVDILLILVVY